MLDATIFKISQLTTSVATLLGSAWIWVNKDSSDGLLFLLFGICFTVGLRLLEQRIFELNFDNGRLS